MNTGKVVLGALAGLAIGATAGILLAPEKGSETRKQIKDKGNDYVDGLKSKFKSTKKDAEEFIERGKEKYEDVKQDVKNAATNFKHDGGAVKNATT